jgi:predicted DNA-binding transcriptional regulator AlpA
MSDEFLDHSAVQALSGFSAATLSSRVHRGTFPPRIDLQSRALRWSAGEVSAVLRLRNTGATTAEVRALVEELMKLRRERVAALLEEIVREVRAR